MNRVRTIYYSNSEIILILLDIIKKCNYFDVTSGSTILTSEEISELTTFNSIKLKLNNNFYKAFPFSFIDSIEYNIGKMGIQRILDFGYIEKLKSEWISSLDSIDILCHKYDSYYFSTSNNKYITYNLTIQHFIRSAINTISTHITQTNNSDKYLTYMYDSIDNTYEYYLSGTVYYYNVRELIKRIDPEDLDLSLSYDCYELRVSKSYTNYIIFYFFVSRETKVNRMFLKIEENSKLVKIDHRHIFTYIKLIEDLKQHNIDTIITKTRTI